MIDNEKRDEILRRLKAAEEEHGVRIILAVESGSRAWGFASPNSDYDIRFIYFRPKLDYLSILVEKRRDVIEYPIVDDIDCNGWDLRKALQLFNKSNPGIVEWLQSPIVYLESGAFASKARALLPEIYSTKSGTYHYFNSARSNYETYFKGPQAPLKKYFYVLRPLLAIRWIEKYGQPPPIEFERLMDMIRGETGLSRDIAKLLELKMALPEMGLADRVASLDRFIELELGRAMTHPRQGVDQATALAKIDQLFRDTLGITES